MKNILKRNEMKTVMYFLSIVCPDLHFHYYIPSFKFGPCFCIFRKTIKRVAKLKLSCDTIIQISPIYVFFLDQLMFSCDTIIQILVHVWVSFGDYEKI